MASLVASPGSVIADEQRRPNIVLILADDLGFSDLASYGSEISTPNLDELARQGLRFSNFHMAANCAPSRAMLLTGVDSHRAGVPNIEEAISAQQSASPLYRGTLRENVVTVATLLKDQGYNTYMAGKWHLGYKKPEMRPINQGFEKTVMMPLSGADNWEQKSYLPAYSRVDWFENGEKIQLPEDFYSSEYIVDRTIEFIGAEREDDKPFFSYVAFQAVHFPVQAPRAYTDKYLDTYTDGWSALREQRYDAAQQLGLVPENVPMTTIRFAREWDSLTADQQAFHAKSMAVYAGMVDAMDHHIGRLVQHLKDIGEYDNTIFIFTSDNGAEPTEAVDKSRILSVWMSLVGYDRNIETLGERGSYNYIGPEFASAAVSPFGQFKFYSGEGGLRVPMIISGAPIVNDLKGQFLPTFTHVTDVTPTILQLTNTSAPGANYKGREVEPVIGKSLVPLLDGSASDVYAPQDAIGYEMGGNAALYKGDYKLAYNRPPQGDNEWHLYNIKLDPGEASDLREIEPNVFEELLRDYQNYAEQNGVVAVVDDYDIHDQVLNYTINERVYKPLRILGPVLFTLGWIFVWLFRRWRKNLALSQ